MTPSERAWDALGDAVVMVDVDNDVVLWVSRGFRELLQLDTDVGQTGGWSELVARIDGLASVSQGNADEQRKILLPNPVHPPAWLEVQRAPLTPGQWVLRLIDPMDRERAQEAATTRPSPCTAQTPARLDSRSLARAMSPAPTPSTRRASSTLHPKT